MKLAVVALTAAASACVAPGYARLDVKTVFAEITFPEEEPKPQREANLVMQLYAAAQLELLTAWDNPEAIANFLSTLDASELRQAGIKLEAKEKPFEVQEVAIELIARSQLTPRDRALLALSFSRYALMVRATARTTTASPEEATKIIKAGADAAHRIAALLRLTPDAGTGVENTNHPSLALSGGAANGAFTAGYLYELLLDRELALMKQDAGPMRDDADKQERFGAVVGTSVGSLQTQIVDLYFSSDASIPTLGGAFFGTTADYDTYPAPTAPPTGRPFQSFVLQTLYRSFVTLEEPFLICAEDAPVTALLGVLAESRPNLMRFDPMSKNVIDPLLRATTERMLSNGLNTTVVAVETMQNQVLGLDERACRRLSGEPGDKAYFAKGSPAYCRSAGVMASVVLPFFARPLAHAYSGLTEEGEDGAWLDGGLRSTLPVYRALRLSRPREGATLKTLRVLALSTLRAEGLPSAFPADVKDVALNAIGQMSSQTIANEVVMAEQFAARRDQEYQDYKLALEHQPFAGPGAERSDAVHAVFVPTDAAPGLVAESGYAFDKFVMRGLFTWGRQRAIRDLLGLNPEGEREAGPETKPKPKAERRLAVRLGWTTLAPDMAAAAESHRDDVDTIGKQFTASEVARTRPQRFKEGRARILGALPLCGWLGDQPKLDESPAYFFPGGKP